MKSDGSMTLSEIAFHMGSGTLAVLGVIALPTLLGLWLDGFFGWVFLFPCGLLFGMICGVLVLIRLAQKWTPVARRSTREIPFEDSDLDENRDEEQR